MNQISFAGVAPITPFPRMQEKEFSIPALTKPAQNPVVFLRFASKDREELHAISLFSLVSLLVPLFRRNAIAGRGRPGWGDRNIWLYE